METSRDPRGVPSGDGAGGRTPHSKLQLQMSDAPSAGWDNTHVWIHHDENGNARLITCVERRTEHGYEYAVVTPYSVEVYDLHDFMAQVNARRQKLHVRDKYRKQLWQALTNDLFATMEILRDIQNRHVGEVVSDV